jgi:hypothetical protein
MNQMIYPAATPETTATSGFEQYLQQARAAGCPADQIQNLTRAGIVLQPRQLAASAAARLCDLPNGPTAIGFGGARCGGKSHWLLAQIGADDCQRYPGLKVLLLRKSGKTNREAFEDLRQRLFANLKHSYSASTGVLIFENGSRIVIKHYQHENEINNSFLGIEYDVIAIEEATTLTARKYSDVLTSLRTSKPNWRPRLYSTTNPGGVGHEWYRKTFVVPYECHNEFATRFIPARVDDNKFTNPEYKIVLAERTGWQKDAWYYGKWDIAAGQFFDTFNHSVHVIHDFNPCDAVEWFAAMDYGYTHYTVVLLACRDAHGNVYVVDEHAERHWIPARHVRAIKEMLQRHQVFMPRPRPRPTHQHIPVCYPPGYVVNPKRVLSWFAAGGDVFSNQYDGCTIASQFSELGITIRPANTDRVHGWAEILRRLGDPANGIKPSLFIHQRCTRLLDCLPFLQHDPDHPADVLKINTNEEGLGGDDAADALRYLLATRVPQIHQVKLRGF